MSLTMEPVRQAGTREWLGLAVLALPTLLLSLDVSVLYLALPHIGQAMQADSTQQLWILDIYSFVLAGFLVTMGGLGDRIGRRRLLLIGAVAFGVASVAAAYSTTPEMLIGTRALLGIAGATLMPSTLALIGTMFPNPKQRQSAVGLWFACFMAGMTLGPIVGGLLLRYFWWGSAFLLGVPFMVLLLVCGPFLLPEFRDQNKGRIDLLSTGLSLATVLPVIYGVKDLARNGIRPAALLAICAGTLMGYLFLKRQREIPAPLLPLGLFRDKTFRAALVTLLLIGIVMAGLTLMSTMFLQLVSELSIVEVGLWLIAPNVALVAGSIAAPVIARKAKLAHVFVASLAIAAVGAALIASTGPSGQVPLLITGLTLTSFGIAVPMALNTGLMLSSAPPELAGSAAAVQETSGEFGVAAGIALLGSLGTAVYRLTLGDDVPPAARDGITAAVQTAAKLPAQEAFTAAVNVVAAVGALAFAGLAVMALIVLREPKQTQPVSAG